MNIGDFVGINPIRDEGQSLNSSVGGMGKVIHIVKPFVIIDLGEHIVGCLDEYVQVFIPKNDTLGLDFRE